MLYYNMSLFQDKAIYRKRCNNIEQHNISLDFFHIFPVCLMTLMKSSVLLNQNGINDFLSSKIFVQFYEAIVGEIIVKF